jgi:hypothetical protein
MTVNNSGNPFIDNNKATQVNRFHVDADTDNGREALHHTLGYGPGQAGNGYEIKQALDGIDTNLNTLNDLINDLAATQQDLLDQTAILAKVGKRIEYYADSTSTIPSGASAPYTAFTGFAFEAGDAAADVGVTYSGGGVFTCLDTGSYNFEVALNWAANPTNRRVIFVNLNSTATGGNSYYRFTVNPSNSAVYLQFHKFDINLVQGDVLRFAVFQDSGAAIARSTADGIQRGSSSYSQMVGITRILG